MVLSALIAVLLVIAGAAYWLVSANGFSARSQPTLIERVVMRALHRFGVPAAARDAVNPVAFSDEAWAESRAHFADHCATCHGNDGAATPKWAAGFSSKAPDMRLAATQNKTDGELYWIIENGIRLTGMPAWGKGGGDDLATWKLVYFVRHLEHLTPEQLKAMAKTQSTVARRTRRREGRRTVSGRGRPGIGSLPTTTESSRHPTTRSLDPCKDH